MEVNAMEWLNMIYSWVWGAPMLLLLLGNGIFLTIALRGFQFRYLVRALKLVVASDEKKAEGDISNFASLMTALAASIGIGNIAGVATALAVGGLGALFWMWVMAFLGMSTKFAEAFLAVKFRSTDSKGEMCGGPMYFIEQGLGWKWLAVSFALFGAIAAFGGGNMIQANSVADALKNSMGIDPWVTGVVLAVVTGLTIIGGIKSIGKVASYLVPFMALFYVSGGLLILTMFYDRIPQAFYMIFQSAFTGQAAFGGFAGSTMYLALRTGLSRGLMTSETGLGTASIVAAAAKTNEPGQQALISMTSNFFATGLLCTVTGLVLAVTNAFGTVDADGKLLNGASMTMAAFQSVLPWGGYIVTIGLVLFALTTLLGWAYYGEKCMEYLFGVKCVPIYRILFILVIIPGAVLDLELVWKIADITNGLMAYPNLIGVTALSYVVIGESREFFASLHRKRHIAQPATES